MFTRKKYVPLNKAFVFLTEIRNVQIFLVLICIALALGNFGNQSYLICHNQNNFIKTMNRTIS